MKIKVIITDGVIDTVLMDQAAMDTDIDIQIVDYDSDCDSHDALLAEYETDGLQDAPFNVTHPGE